ncbi:40S ribosomal protein S11 [Drosophila elegans]|uniref:40S ribosomal protein S11 n=1 Tax=Drosophila elegans TaxID=30023 RepID=UPI001BC83E7A|nr:40S ribosomal protein S11 [Drosophila elegans]
MADQQTERAFRKQHAVVVVRRKSATLKKRPRFYRQIGLGFRAPAEVRGIRANHD